MSTCVRAPEVEMPGICPEENTARALWGHAHCANQVESENSVRSGEYLQYGLMLQTA